MTLKQFLITMAIIWITVTLFLVFFFDYIYAMPPDWFEKGKFVTNTEGWEYRYHGKIYHYGMMVSPASLVATLIIIFSLIGAIVYTGIKEHGVISTQKQI